MMKQEYVTTELLRMPVYDVKKPKRKIGKIHAFVFHPHKRCVIGFTVKRPDVALMFHRSDLFVALDAFDITDDNHILIEEVEKATGNAACKRLGVAWDECIIWQGMSLLSEDGTFCGYVGDIRFNVETGAVISLGVDRSKSKDLLLGTVEIPASMILGFKQGVGDKLDCAEGEDFMYGGIIIATEALELRTEGGLAEKAGAGAALAGNKASEVAQRAKPMQDKAVQKTSEAVNSGAYALGRQLNRSKSMFSDFKEEYRRARDGE